MRTPAEKQASNTSMVHRSMAFMVGLIAALSSTSALSADINLAKQPLYLGSNVPGNLALVPSVEFPTAISRANLDNGYQTSRTYVGYFDSAKCYDYHYSTVEAERHFYPVGMAGTGFTCAGTQWSGNFMNWAATQTIDPFRKALTGGYRVKDTPTETWVEKAIADRDSTSNFPRYDLTSAALASATPVQWGNNIKMRIDGLGNKMRFTTGGNTGSPGSHLIAYNPSTHPLDAANVMIGGNPVPGGDAVYEVSVRVKVCDSAVGLESNCVAYTSGFKPEGLIQEYSNRVIYSIFGYQNYSAAKPNIDGGILRAQQKFVGPQTYYPDEGVKANPAQEWDPATGVLYQNPDSADAAATTLLVGDSFNYPVVNSGVINYLNKFGQMNTGQNIKSYDNVSELYYTAVRYFKHLGNVSAYSAMSGSAQAKFRRADAFPVITDWNDPIKYACQANVVLGIGDTNTHVDKNLPGPTDGTLENAKQPEVVADNTVDVVDVMKKIFIMEGNSVATATTKASANQFNGNNNSAYIAALAYDSHIRDIRPDLAGKQTLSTHWVDVVEYGDFKSESTNQYWLTGKYGGFRVPDGYDPNNTTPLDPSLWRSTADLVNGNAAMPRPDNFYVASDAQKMVDSLTLAFKNILADMKGAGGSFASNTTRLETGAMTFQAQFFSGKWGGELLGYNIDPATGAMSLAWAASSQFPVWGPTNATTGARQIFHGAGGAMTAFEYGNLAGTPLASESQKVIDYLRGDRSNEMPGGTLRERRGVLGDIVNSQPIYVGTPSAQLYKNKVFSGASAYPAFAAAHTAASRTPVVYVGANDGMLHAFEAATGKEIFAFVPQAAMGALTGPKSYSEPDYEHVYTVDGDITVADVYFTGSSSWKTVLVGSMGRGGRSVFALDVTDPHAPVLLWEIDETDVPELGNTMSQPIIGQISDGQWRVFLGNGPNGSGGGSELLMLDVANGSATVVSAGTGPKNGLSGVNAWASTTSGFVDTVYAGDLLGNMWKFTGIDSSPSSSLLFATGSSKPISATPLVARNPATLETWVFFGTGRYLNGDDVTNKDVQTWYGLIDKGTLPISAANLRKTDILNEGPVSGRTVRSIDAYATPGINGWYMDLKSPVNGAEGERMIEPNFFRGLALIGTTRIPESTDVCSPSGKGFTMAIQPFTGGRLPQTFFDINKDGKFDSNDTLGGVPVSGIGYESSPNNPIFLGDIMYTSLDDGTSDVMKTNASASNVRRVSWREHTRSN